MLDHNDSSLYRKAYTAMPKRVKDELVHFDNVTKIIVPYHIFSSPNRAATYPLSSSSPHRRTEPPLTHKSPSPQFSIVPRVVQYFEAHTSRTKPSRAESSRVESLHEPPRRSTGIHRRIATPDEPGHEVSFSLLYLIRTDYFYTHHMSLQSHVLIGSLTAVPLSPIPPHPQLLSQHRQDTSPNPLSLSTDL
jgi:hypothetical protein